MTTQLVLVPGFWLGKSAWDAVATELRPHGHRVDALTLPGLEVEHPDRGSITLDDHVAAISAALDRDASRRVLVVHSGAAFPGTMVLDRHTELVDHVVFVDTCPVTHGSAEDASHSGPELPLDHRWTSIGEEGSLRDLTDEQLDAFRSTATPQPGRTVHDPVQLSNPDRLTVPGTIVCTAFSASDYRAYADQGVPFLAGLHDHNALELVDLPTGHWPMWSRPKELADLLHSVA